MPKREVYICDGCGREKKETNSWYKMLVGDALSLWPWKHEGANYGSPILYMCGASCVTKKVEEFMGAQKKAHDKAYAD
jgi:hypothetical protein